MHLLVTCAQAAEASELVGVHAPIQEKQQRQTVRALRASPPEIPVWGGLGLCAPVSPTHPPLFQVELLMRFETFKT